MNHLGLRIYRFYIRCTACVSEIVFRTDPANTDYVLEAGATRNFEALAKAEKIAEEEQKAHAQELQDNPMKLLEERTEASKNEMARMEALEELHDLNKRTIKVDYETMLEKYERLREVAAKREEEDDEAFVKSIFGKDSGSGGTIKRIVDAEEGDSSDEEFRRTKKIKVDKPTDLLGKKEDEASAGKKEAWQKSIGMMSKKGGLGVLVRKKPNATAKAKDAEKKGLSASGSESHSVPKPGGSNPKPASSGTSSALGMLGGYSGSSSDSD